MLSWDQGPLRVEYVSGWGGDLDKTENLKCLNIDRQNIKEASSFQVIHAKRYIKQTNG